MSPKNAEFHWNVQSYRTIGELRDNYTTFALVVSRNAMDEIAAEATQWMRQNARWHDRPEEQKIKSPSLYEQTHHARDELVAVAIDNDENKQAVANFEAGLGAAKKIDVGRLKAENARLRAEHIQKLRDQEDEYFAKHGRANETVSRSRTKEQAGYGKLKSLPPEQSAAFAYTQANQPKLIPIATIIFKYRDPENLTYAIWLEVGMGGRFSIIAPAVDYWYPKTVGKVKQMLNLVQYKHLSISAQETDIMERLAFPESHYATASAREARAEGRDKYRPYGTPERMKQRRANKQNYRNNGRVVYSDY